jgi:hypothetical protein
LRMRSPRVLHAVGTSAGYAISHYTPSPLKLKSPLSVVLRSCDSPPTA